MKLFIGSDRVGYELKNELVISLSNLEYEVIDIGPFEYKSVHYPDVAIEVAQNIIHHQNSFGILICSTGIGMSITANKVKGVRAANCTSIHLAEHARLHNNANVICFGASVIKSNSAFEMSKRFLNTPFEGGKHSKRLEIIQNLENGSYSFDLNT